MTIDDDASREIIYPSNRYLSDNVPRGRATRGGINRSRWSFCWINSLVCISLIFSIARCGCSGITPDEEVNFFSALNPIINCIVWLLRISLWWPTDFFKCLRNIETKRLWFRLLKVQLSKFLDFGDYFLFMKNSFSTGMLWSTRLS